MEFGEFKEKVVEGLQEIYGDSADIETGVALKNNGSKYNGINIFLKDSGSRTSPVIDLDRLYKLFENGTLNIGDCVWDIYHKRTSLSGSEEVEQLAKNISDWESVKYDIYPILLSTEENKELLERLVSTPMLDLSIAYVIRGELSGKDTVSIKITKSLLESYGISAKQLHMQAMENMGKDGYEFLEMETMIREILHVEEVQSLGKPELYVLTNSARSYGAAGILNNEMLREFARGRDFIILPSSVHETLFVPVTGEPDQAFFDEMVMEVNRKEVSLEEKLADHSYYYDAQIGEIRMCA